MKPLPLLLKINQSLLLVVLLVIVLYYGKPLLIPVFFAILLAMLMAPVCRFLDGKGLNRTLSSLIPVLILLLAFAGIIAIVVAQIASFSEDMSLIERKFSMVQKKVQAYIEERMGISRGQQQTMVKEQAKNMSAAGAGAGKVLAGITGTLGGTAITLVFTFLLLYHKEKYERFFLRLYKKEEEARVKEVLGRISHVSQQYLTGRVLSMLFLFALYAVALTAIGLKNALLLSAIAALLTIIPYVGPILGGLFPILVALVTEDSIQTAIWVCIALVVIQALDNYFVEPYVIGSEVSLSALFTIISIIAGGLLWGIAGMILFIPMMSIAKIIFDEVEELQPYGYVIGDQGKSASNRLREWLSRLFKGRQAKAGKGGRA